MSNSSYSKIPAGNNRARDTPEKKRNRAMEKIRVAVNMQADYQYKFIDELVVQPLARDHPAAELGQFSTDSGGWMLEVKIKEQSYAVMCTELPHMEAAAYRDYDPDVTVSGPGLGMKTGKADEVLLWLKQAVLPK